MRICRRIRLIAAFVLVPSATVAMAAVAVPPSGSELPRRIVVTNSASWVPYSFLDHAGQPRGVLIEFWRLFARKNNVEVEFKLVDWAKSLEMVRNGEADVHGGLTETDQRRESLYFYQREILRVRTVVFFDEEVGIRDLASMSDMTVGVIAETAEEEFLRSNFPNILLKRYPNSYTLIKSAVDGQIPAFISDYPTGYYHLVLQHNLDRFQTGATLYTRPLCIATRLSDAKLDRIGISITEIPRAEVLRVLNKWLIPEAEIPLWFWPTVIAGLLALVLAGIGVHLFALRRVLDIKGSSINNCNNFHVDGRMV
jgi:ABC-type amino acid transport substrate-binding protein